MADGTETCPTCGAALPAGTAASGGLCPACLMRRGLETNTVGFSEGGGGGGQARPRWEAPTCAELAGEFPQLEVIELLGRGGMGAVYKVRQRELDRVAALKVLPPHFGAEVAFAGRFAREAKALAKLNHPNVVTLYEFGRTPGAGLYYFLMEHVDGASLRRLMDAGRVAPREALAIVPQVCDALQYAHDHGVVHRDVKPENILLDRRGRVKVADFGLAKIVGQEEAGAATSSGAGAASAAGVMVTEAGQVVGTPQYMAPEQVERPGAVDHRADIYALGVVFYQMLTGELPAGGRIEPPSRKVTIDVRLDEVVLRALEREPGRRYGQASVMRAEVERVSGVAEPGGGTEGSPGAVGGAVVLPYGRGGKGWRVAGARRWMMLFGALDLGVVAASLGSVPSIVRGLPDGWVSAGVSLLSLLMLVSLGVSGYGLLRGRWWAFGLNYAQFPLRLLLGYLSFSWLARVILPDGASIRLNEAVWGAAVALEGIRLGLTIMLHVGRGRREEEGLMAGADGGASGGEAVGYDGGHGPGRFRVGPVAMAMIMAVVLVPVAWVTLGLPPLGFSPLAKVLSGDLFDDRVVSAEQNRYDRLDPHRVRDFLWYFAVVAGPVLLYVAAARGVSDRRTRAGYWAYAGPAAAVCVCLLIVLTIPFYWLAQYTASMGVTRARVEGLLAGVGGYAVILGVMWWAVRKGGRGRGGAAGAGDAALSRGGVKPGAEEGPAADAAARAVLGYGREGRRVTLRSLRRPLMISGGVMGALALVAVAVLVWVQRPTMIGSVVSADSPDGRYTATVTTMRAMRVFGGDETSYRVVVRGPGGVVAEAWDVPVPYQRLDAQNAAVPLAQVVFSSRGRIRWSDDSSRVAFELSAPDGRKVEVAGYNVRTDERSAQPGFLPERRVTLAGSRTLEGCFADLDTGEVLGAPAEWVETLKSKGQLYEGATPPSVLREWAEPAGVDLFKSVTLPGGGGNGWAVLHLGGVVTYMSESSFSFDTITAGQVAESTRAGTGTSADASGNGGGEPAFFPLKPDTLNVFRTREGGAGVLEYREAGSGRIEVRYKLLAEPPSDNTEAGGSGATVERVLPDPDNGHPDNQETLRLGTGQMLNVLTGEPSDGGRRLWALLEGEGDLFAEHGDVEVGTWALVTAGLRLADLTSNQWDTATAADVAAALKTPTAMRHVEYFGAVIYTLPEAFVPLTLAFEARDGSRGLLQVTRFNPEPRSVGIRYKLVGKPAAAGTRPVVGLGAVTERALRPVRGQPAGGLDLDAGREVGIAADAMEGVPTEAPFNRFAAQGIDLLVDREGQQGWALWTSLRLARLKPGAWEKVRGADVGEALASGSDDMEEERTDLPAGYVRYDIGRLASEFPLTFAFQTTFGTRGVMQVLGFTKNPDGVRVRYRLLGRPEGPATRPGR